MSDIPIPQEDLAAFVQLAEDRHCIDTTAPTLTLGRITIIQDEHGRIYYGPTPYRAHMQWCTLGAEFEGKLDVVSAKKEEPISGFDLRLKLYGATLPLYAIQHGITRATDLGLALEFFHIGPVGIDVHAGIQTLGAGLSYRITRTIDAYAAYGLRPYDLSSQAVVGLAFDLGL